MTPQNHKAEYLRELQHVLRHLYEPGELRKSPFVGRFGIDLRADTMLELRKILLDGIQKLKPQGRIIPTSKAWKIYTVLSLRFVEQFSQKQVAADLSIGIRQLRRLEILALEVLADVLAKQLVPIPPTELALSPIQSTPPPSDAPYARQELEWLRRSMSGETIDLQSLLDSSLHTVAPLFQANRVTVDVQLAEGNLFVGGQLTTLRQAVVNVLTLAGQMAPDGQLQIQVETQPEQALLRIQAVGVSQPQSLLGPQGEIADMVRHLLELSGGQLELHWPQSPHENFAAYISLPVANTHTVLVVDDNQDALQLVRRYLAGSHYHFVGTADPHQAIRLALETHPEAMILDVMLPEVDGWELLGRLREHPALQATPIIVSTILPQETLAMTLGASAFLHKPFNQTDLLALLDRFGTPAERESH